VVEADDAAEETDAETIGIGTTVDHEDRDVAVEEVLVDHPVEDMAVDLEAEGMEDPEDHAVMADPEEVEVDGLDPRWTAVMEVVLDDEEVEEVMADHVDHAVVTVEEADMADIKLCVVALSMATITTTTTALRSVSGCMLYTEYMGYTVH